MASNRTHRPNSRPTWLRSSSRHQPPAGSRSNRSSGQTRLGTGIGRPGSRRIHRRRRWRGSHKKARRKDKEPGIHSRSQGRHIGHPVGKGLDSRQQLWLPTARAQEASDSSESPLKVPPAAHARRGCGLIVTTDIGGIIGRIQQFETGRIRDSGVRSRESGSMGRSECNNFATHVFREERAFRPLNPGSRLLTPVAASSRAALGPPRAI
jgi:hypothetical protein